MNLASDLLLWSYHGKRLREHDAYTADNVPALYGATNRDCHRRRHRLAYRLIGDEEHDCARVSWEGDSVLSADGLLNSPGETKRDAAAEFLEGLLADGPMPASEVKEEAEAEGISERTLKRAKQELGVEAVREGRSGEIGGDLWCWRLPFKGATDLDLGGQPSTKRVASLKSAGQDPLSNGNSVSEATSSGTASFDSLDLGEFDFDHDPAPCETCGQPCIPRHLPSARVVHPACLVVKTTP